MKRRFILVACLALLALDWALGQAAAASPRVIVAGSSCMGRVSTALSEGYAGRGGTVEVQLGGTQLGLQSLRGGVADIASCSRALTGDEADLLGFAIAVDAIAVVVHENNPIKGLSAAQLRDIYEGRIDNWGALGGPDLTIVPIGRESGSGTRTAFETGIGLRGSPRHGQELCETGMVRTAVAQTPGSIGYLSVEYVSRGVRAVAVDGQLPSAEAIGRGRYPLARPLLFCVRQSGASAATRDFLEYATGSEGRQIITRLGMIPPPDHG